MSKGSDSQETAPPKEYITISRHLSDGKKLLCNSALLPWYHKWHVKGRLWIAKRLIKSCTRFASPITVATITGTINTRAKEMLK